MKKEYQHTKIQVNQVSVLIYLVFVLAVFIQHQPYQKLVQEPTQEGIKSAPDQQFSQSALASSEVDFKDTDTKLPFGLQGSSQFSASGFSTCLFFEGHYRQAFKAAYNEFLSYKPDLVKQWQLEKLSMTPGHAIIS